LTCLDSVHFLRSSFDGKETQNTGAATQIKNNLLKANHINKKKKKKRMEITSSFLQYLALEIGSVCLDTLPIGFGSGLIFDHLSMNSLARERERERELTITIGGVSDANFIIVDNFAFCVPTFRIDESIQSFAMDHHTVPMLMKQHHHLKGKKK
jgi:hypothetical protein